MVMPLNECASPSSSSARRRRVSAALALALALAFAAAFASAAQEDGYYERDLLASTDEELRALVDNDIPGDGLMYPSSDDEVIVLTINGSVSSLAPLNEKLRKLDGTLNIQFTTELEAVELDKLEFVNFLDIIGNERVASVNLSGLTKVGSLTNPVYSNLYIRFNPLLQDVRLDALESLLRDLKVEDNPMLSALACPNLQKAGQESDLFIIDNTALASLDFPKLQSVKSWVIESCPMLTTLDMPDIRTPAAIEGAESRQVTQSDLEEYAAAQTEAAEEAAVETALDNAFWGN